MDSNLKIDDEYVQNVGKVCDKRGLILDSNYSDENHFIFNSYINILTSIKDEAICEGEISKALNAYIECAKQIKGQLNTISTDIKKVCDSFIMDIDEADQYIF